MSQKNNQVPLELTAQTQAELIVLARKALLSGLTYDEVQDKIARFATQLTVSERIEEKQSNSDRSKSSGDFPEQCGWER